MVSPKARCSASEYERSPSPTVSTRIGVSEGLEDGAQGRPGAVLAKGGGHPTLKHTPRGWRPLTRAVTRVRIRKRAQQHPASTRRAPPETATRVDVRGRQHATGTAALARRRAARSWPPAP
eukprot:scaffold89169_cov60-Phaeocystis_antarctica.AAC.2